MTITLFSTPNCVRCKMLSNLLKDKNIDYTESHNIKEVIANGFMSAPVLKVGDKYMAMPDALRWVNEQ